ncbi:MAG: hypothetical protein U0175_10875 [Caldilineaceae bacterium]
MSDRETENETPPSAEDESLTRIDVDSEEQSSAEGHNTDAQASAAESESAEDGNEEGEDDEEDSFRMWMAILIAIVTLVGAWMGWVTAGISGVAGDSASGGMDAVINAESTLTLNSIALYKHYRAFTDYARYQSTADLLAQEAAQQPDAAPTRKSDVDDLAAVQLPFFLSRYLTRDGAYNSRRELGEAWAENEQKMDLDPIGYFQESDLYSLKTKLMMGLFVILSLSLLFYTLAEGLHAERPFWRYTAAILGTVTLTLSIAGTLWVDRWMG